MPSRSENSIPHFPEHVPRADISTVDFSLLAAGDEVSAQAVYNSARGYGFFCVKNYDIDSDFMFDLANTMFKLPDEEKMKYDMGSTGGYFGCKRSASQYVDGKGTPDYSEFYNVSKDDILHVGGRESLRHPEPVNQRRTELENFMHSSHHVITVIARVLGEHTDFGSITVLFNQLGGLQVLNPSSHEWKYVKPQAGCAILNLGDAIVKLVGERLYSALHRLVGPPGEQAKYPRHSVVYFSRPNGDVRLGSLFDSAEDRQKAMAADEWIIHRAKLRNMANFKGAETMHHSRVTEHHRERYRVKASLDTPAPAVEAK